MKHEIQPTAEDWIILRLVRFAYHNAPIQAAVSRTVYKSFLHIMYRLGSAEVMQMLGQLDDEEGFTPPTHIVNRMMLPPKPTKKQWMEGVNK